MTVGKEPVPKMLSAELPFESYECVCASPHDLPTMLVQPSLIDFSETLLIGTM